MSAIALEKKLAEVTSDNKSKVDLLAELSEEYLNDDDAKSYVFSAQAVDIINKLNLDREEYSKLYTIMECFESTHEQIELPKIFLKAGHPFIISLPDTALFCCNKGLEYSESLDNFDEKASLHNNIGIIYFHRCDFDSAAKSFKKSLVVYEGQNNKAGMSKSHNNIGTVLCRHGDFNDALPHFFKSMELCDEMNNKTGFAFCSTNIGNINYEQGKLDKALEYYKKSLEVFEDLQEIMGLALGYNNLGSVYNDKGEYELALETLEKSLEYKIELGDEVSISGSYANIGDVHRSLGNYDKAREYFEKTLCLKQKLNDRNGIALTYNNISELDLKQERYAEAEKNANLSLEISLEFELLAMQRLAYKQLYKLNEATSNYKEALKWHKLYKEINDKICNEDNSNQLNEIQTKYDSEKKEKEAEIYRLRNIELAKANDDIKLKNEELKTNKEHLELINKILRHDLTNNLSVLRSCFRLFDRSKDVSVLIEGAKYVDKSFKLINKMKNHEKLCGAGKLILIDLNEFMKQFIKNYPQVKFIVQAGCQFYANDALNSVLDNLISNAISHGKASEILVTFDSKGSNCRLRVADNGTGIPDEIKGKIFEEGFKYGNTGKNGIGLYIVKKSMEEMGGDVMVRDHKPQGTEFILSF